MLVRAAIISFIRFRINDPKQKPSRWEPDGLLFYGFWDGLFLSGGLYVRRLFAFGPLRDFKRDFLPLFQGLEAIHLDCRKMGEQVVAAIIRGDESVTLGIVEPFDCTSCHMLSSLPACLPIGLTPARMAASTTFGNQESPINRYDRVFLATLTFIRLFGIASQAPGIFGRFPL